MILVAVAAGLSWLYQAVNGFAFVVLIGYFAMIAGLSSGPWCFVKADRRLAGRTLVISACLACLSLAALGIFSLGYLAFAYRAMVGFALLPILLGSGVAWVKLSTSTGAEPRHRPIAAWSLLVLLIALSVSMMFSHWPMRVAFLASRPALDRLADRIASGERLERPEWAGLFRVRKVARADVGPGNIALVVDNDSTGHTWLIRTASPWALPATPSPAHLRERIGRDGLWWHHERD